MGQFFTPSSVALIMSSMFKKIHSSINLVDPGAGVGALSAAFISRLLQENNPPGNVHITAYELDKTLIPILSNTLGECQKLCAQSSIHLTYIIRNEDFIASSVEQIAGRESLFPVEQPKYNCAIINPPYKKITTDSKSSRLLRSVGIDTTNLYTAFMWLVSKLLLPDSEMVAIVPRSFCNGLYFKPFRQHFLRNMSICQIHLFASRDKAFKDGNVLQENIIIHARKSDIKNSKVIITTNDHPEDLDIISREIDYDQLVNPTDQDYFIRLVSDRLGHDISNLMEKLTTQLKDLGVSVSTGPVVDFRSRKYLCEKSNGETIPLIYPHHFDHGRISWPSLQKKKPEYLSALDGISNLVVPSKNYVLVKRFSSKEEKRRVYAAVFEASKFQVDRIGIENHVNYYHKQYGNLSIDLAKGLAVYLNSSLVDHYFRLFSGHTQVNATDLRNLKYPTEEQLISFAKAVGDGFPDQNEIDQLISQELTNHQVEGEDVMSDPIQAKKRVTEALNILQSINVPRLQQNDRSALTLLSLADIRPEIVWQNASENLIGITEMMDFFRDHYGINYAPNTRETVRRQTIHQFLQLGLVVENPDDPNRPINSPKTRYKIASDLLGLLRTYNTSNWENSLALFVKQTNMITNLQVRERSMPLIPVTLPDGDKLFLTSGGQNELIKHIIEEFCPRYTPGGKLIYVGDAGSKITETELQYFQEIGITIDKHGKMPDLIIEVPEKKWLVIVEAVTSHGPIDIKRKNELMELFTGSNYGLVFITAFENKKNMHKYFKEISWGTDIWIADTPSHLIHLNGERFLGPYTA